MAELISQPVSGIAIIRRYSRAWPACAAARSAGAMVAGIPAGDMAEWRRNVSVFARLDALRKRVGRLEAELSLLQGRGKKTEEEEGA